MKNNNLKYLIAGTGGVGGSIAAFLALAGKGRHLYCPWRTSCRLT